LGLELVWSVFRRQCDRWDAGLVTGESLRRAPDWNGWRWRRPTFLLIDYAHTVDEELVDLFRALARKAADPSLPPLRVLLLEREASAAEGWFHRLLSEDPSGGGGPVRGLFDPQEPVRLHPLSSPGLRRAVLDATLKAAAAYDGRPLPAVPPPGRDPAFDAKLAQPIWNDPLYLMMAALVTHGAGGAAGGRGPAALTAALGLGRADLSLELARRELSRLDRFLPAGSGPGARKLFRHLAACATLSGGWISEQAAAAAEEEMAAVAWRGRREQARSRTCSTRRCRRRAARSPRSSRTSWRKRSSLTSGAARSAPSSSGRRSGAAPRARRGPRRQ
jgi:hypothetical protein